MQKVVREGSRTNNGSMIMFVGLFCLMVLLPLGILSFELLRVNFAREQLQANCDAAALAATAALTSSSARSSAPKEVAAALFRRNSILQYELKNARLVADVDRIHVAPGNAAISVHFLGADDNPVNGNPNRPVRRVQVKGLIGYAPPFGHYLGLGNYELRAIARAGLPKIDMSLVMDVSNSMTVDTRSLYVKRYSVGTGATLDDPNLRNVYEVVGREGEFDGNHNDYDVNETSGLSVPVPGQMLMKTRVGDLKFDPILRNPASNQGSCPGNIEEVVIGGSRVYKSMPPGGAVFSELVVDLTEVRENGVQIFPNIATIVEAARGNMDNVEVYAKSHAMSSYNADPVNGPRADLVGIATKEKYEECAYKNLQPWSRSVALTRDFVSSLGESSDIHLGLIPFATLAAQAPEEPNGTRSIKDHCISRKYNPPDLGVHGDGIGAFRLMQVPLKKDRSGVDAVLNEIGRLHHHYGTNTADALNEAKKMIAGDRAQVRSDARRAVVIITDGLPVAPHDELIELNNIAADRQHQDMHNDTFRIAREIGEKGIPIYCVGFLHQGQAAHGAQVLNRIAEEAGHGSKFYLAQNVRELKNALDHIERDLISLTN